MNDLDSFEVCYETRTKVFWTTRNRAHGEVQNHVEVSIGGEVWNNLPVDELRSEVWLNVQQRQQRMISQIRVNINHHIRGLIK